MTANYDTLPLEDDMWFSVETPQVFAEYKLPADEKRWSRTQGSQYLRLVDLADAHGTHIKRTAYRRG